MLVLEHPNLENDIWKYKEISWRKTTSSIFFEVKKKDKLQENHWLANKSGEEKAARFSNISERLD